MKNLNKKGFTLIELLAVIVILGVLLAIAVPAVTKYINSAKKSTYISNVKYYADTLRNDALIGTYPLPVSNNDATAVKFSGLQGSLEKGGVESSYGNKYDLDNCFIIIVNSGTAELPKYQFYIAAKDTVGYGIGTLKDGATTAGIIAYDDLSNENIVQLSTGATFPTLNSKITIGGNQVTIKNAVTQ